MYFYIDNKKIPAFITTKDKKFYISFPFNKTLIEEIKESTEARQWDQATKQWVLNDTRRNNFILNFLLGQDPYAKYDQPLKEINIPKLWKHQQEMYRQCFTKKTCIIAGEMRTGKTRPILQLMADLKMKDTWWIAPKSALRGLKLELVKWDFPYNIYLLSYAKFREIAGGLLEKVPKFIVFDECQKLKNPKSLQGMTARDVSDAQQKKYGEDRFLILLSGTPAPRDPSDWWNLTEVVEPGFLREGSKIQLQKRLGIWEERDTGSHRYWHLVEWKKEEIQLLSERLEGMVSVFLKKDCLDLPDKIYNPITLPIGEDYKKAAQMLRRNVAGAAVLQNKLRQLSDGFQYIDMPDSKSGKDIREVKYFPNCPKDKQFLEDLEEFEESSSLGQGRVICYCGFTATIDKLTRIALEKDWTVLKVDGRGWSVLNSTLSVENCLSCMDRSTDTGQLEKLLFLAQADAASTGLELSASSIIIYYSNTDNGDARMQSEDRPHSNNMDKIKGLEIRDYYHLGVDKLIVSRHKKKQTLQSISLGDIDAIMNF